MEIMTLDLSILVISLIVASLILAFYSLSPKLYDIYSNANGNFAVIDVIRTLKKACPVQFSNKWRLLPLYLGSTRCWTKNISFPGFKNSIKLYGATCAVTCSAMYAFSLISDVSKWGEWEPSHASQNLLLKPFNNNQLKKDHFMQADQIAGIQRGANIQSYIAMYRFLSSPSKCTRWVLFWNAKKFEFMFFLMQPATSRNVDTQCVVTHLYGSNRLSSHSPVMVTQRMRNIKEFLYMSQLNVRPLGYSTSCAPFPPEPSPLKKEFPEGEDTSSVFPEAANCDTSNSVFVLVPFFHPPMFALKRLKGYNLLLKRLSEKSAPKEPTRKVSPPKKPITHEPLRRAVSEMSIPTKSSKNFKDGSFKFSFENPCQDRDSKSISVIAVNDLADKATEVKEEFQTVSNQENSTSSPAVKLRTLSEPAAEDSIKSKSLPETPSEEESHKSLHSISELEESTEILDCTNEFFCSSTSDFELLDYSNQQFIDTRIAGYLTQGNYGASVLQTEMMLASQFDRTMHSGNRVAGGWIHFSTHKGIPLLTKSISGKIMKILSFLCQTEIAVNYKDVWKCVKNPRFRFISDETVKTVQIVDRISDSQRLIHVYHETSGILRKEAVDFCLLQTEREEKDTFYSVFQSIEYEKCPFMMSVTRGSLKPSGWIVQSLTPKSCKVTYLVQILVSSPDNLFIHDLSSLVPQSLHNLKQYITSKPN